MAGNQERAVRDAVAKYGAGSREARDAYNAYEGSMARENQNPKSRSELGVRA